MHTKTYFLIGAGGHAKVVFEAMLLMGESQVGVWDDNLNLSDQEWMDSIIQAPVNYAALGEKGHVAIGNNQIRRDISANLDMLQKERITVIHPQASVSNYAKVGAGSFLAAQAVVGPGSDIGKGVIVNHAAVVDHDCCVGHFTHIAPHATIGGGVSIGENCLIGAGAVILPGLKIANRVTVGAGAVVIRDIQQECIIVWGVPAR